jgi:peroxiredoxin
MTLAQELSHHFQKLGGYNPVVKKSISSAQDQLTVQAQPEIGDIAPMFTLNDENNRSISLHNILNEGPVILTFYRGDWCSFCDLELKALQRHLADFKKYSATLLGISPQTISYSQLTKEKKNLSFSLLSDIGNKIAAQYGLLYKPPVELLNAFDSFGLELGNYNKQEDHLPIPATYVINKKQEVIFRFVNADHTKRAEPSAILAALMSEL